MTIQDLGSIGELIAAIATIATLLYLALQLRENTVAIRGQARRAHRSTSTSVALVIAQDSKVAALFNTGLRSFDALSPEEQTQFAFLFSELVNAASNVYEEIDAGILELDQMDTALYGLGPLIRSPGGRQWWARHCMVYPLAFRNFVNTNLLQSSTQPVA